MNHHQWPCGYDRKAFPHVRVDGRDNDEASIALGRRNAVEYGVADRVDLEVVDLRADETFTAPGDEVQRFIAAAGAVWCRT